MAERNDRKNEKPRDRIRKANNLRTLASGYRSLKKGEAAVYEAAAEAFELVEKRAVANRGNKP